VFARFDHIKLGCMVIDFGLKPRVIHATTFKLRLNIWCMKLKPTIHKSRNLRNEFE
jgi:hypothetical protein